MTTALARIWTTVFAVVCLLCVVGAVAATLLHVATKSMFMRGLIDVLLLGFILSAALVWLPSWIASSRRADRVDRWTLRIVIACVPLLLISVIGWAWIPETPGLQTLRIIVQWVAIVSLGVLVFKMRYTRNSAEEQRKGSDSSH